MKKRSRTKELFSTIRKNSLTTEMWLVLFATLLIFAVVFFFSLRAIIHETRYNNQMRESETVISSVAGNIQADIDNYKELSRLIMLNKEVMNFLRADEVDSGIVNDTKYGIMDVLNVSVNLDSVFIIRNDGYYASTGRGEYDMDFELMNSKEWLTPILDKRGGAIVLMNAGEAIHRKNDIQLITIARAIYDIYTQKQTGILLMNISTRMFERVELASGNSRVCIVGDEGVYLAGEDKLKQFYSPDSSKGNIVFGLPHDNNQNEMISRFSFENYPLTIICSNSSTSYQLSRTTTWVLLSLFLAFAAAMFITAHFVATKINRPIFALSKAMEKTKESGWIEEIDIGEQVNEIGVLVNSYNSMITYMNDLFTRLLEKEKSIQKAEMDVLQEQIKPHFLYNSMETIGFMALDAGAEEVYNALETLGSFYRNFLSKGSKEIPFSREVNIVQDYLSLQKLRYGDIIEDVYDIADDTKDIKVPKLILQPLVENSIYHGIRPKGECCEISIASFLDHGNLHIVVKDTGVGMSEAAIRSVLSVEPVEEVHESNGPVSGFGLKGTIERIRYYCNTNDVVSITSEPGEFTRIEVVIPEAIILEGKIK